MFSSERATANAAFLTFQRAEPACQPPEPGSGVWGSLGLSSLTIVTPDGVFGVYTPETGGDT